MLTGVGDILPIAANDEFSTGVETFPVIFPNTG